MATDLDCLREEQVRETVLRAVAGSRFYRERYAAIDIDRVRHVADLAQLPIITKEDARHAGTAMLVQGLTCSHVQNTSGSTGSPLLIYRSVEECRFIAEFFAHVQERSPTPLPVALTLTVPHHGTPTPVPGRVFVLHSGVSDDELLDHTLLLLEHEFAIDGVEKRVSILTGSPSQLLALTHHVEQRPIRHAVQHIATTGRYLTEHSRDRLRRVWGASVHDTYSLSEIFGGAAACTRCRGFHFDPYVIPEIVSLRDGFPVREGPGRLVLTSLYPFVQLQPFIRYDTGDLFTSAKTSCNALSYFFVGRAAHTLFDECDPARVLIPGTALHECADGVAYVRRTEHFRDTTMFANPGAAGLPHLRGSVEHVAGGQTHVKITVEAEPTAPSTVYTAIGTLLREQLLRYAPLLTHEVTRGAVRLTVEMVATGTVESLSKKAPIWEHNEALHATG